MVVSLLSMAPASSSIKKTGRFNHATTGVMTVMMLSHATNVRLGLGKGLQKIQNSVVKVVSVSF